MSNTKSKTERDLNLVIDRLRTLRNKGNEVKEKSESAVNGVIPYLVEPDHAAFKIMHDIHHRACSVHDGVTDLVTSTVRILEDCYVIMSNLGEAQSLPTKPPPPPTPSQHSAKFDLTMKAEFPIGVYVDVQQTHVPDELKHGVVTGYSEECVKVKHEGHDRDMSWSQHELIRSPFYEPAIVLEANRKRQSSLTDCVRPLKQPRCYRNLLNAAAKSVKELAQVLSTQRENAMKEEDSVLELHASLLRLCDNPKLIHVAPNVSEQVSAHSNNTIDASSTAIVPVAAQPSTKSKKGEEVQNAWDALADLPSPSPDALFDNERRTIASTLKIANTSPKSQGQNSLSLTHTQPPEDSRPAPTTTTISRRASQVSDTTSLPSRVSMCNTQSPSTDDVQINYYSDTDDDDTCTVTKVVRPPAQWVRINQPGHKYHGEIGTIATNSGFCYGLKMSNVALHSLVYKRKEHVELLKSL